MTARQLAEWEAYNTLEPIGQDREDYRFSYLFSILTNIAIKTHGKPGSPLCKTSDFAFDWDFTKPKEQENQSLEQQKRLFEALAQGSGRKRKIKQVDETSKK